MSDNCCSPLSLRVEGQLENNFVLFSLLYHFLSVDLALSEILYETYFSNIAGRLLCTCITGLNVGCRVVYDTFSDKLKRSTVLNGWMA